MLRSVRLFFISIMILAFPVCLAAQTLSWHADQLIEDNAGYNGANPQVVISNNRAVAVWHQDDESRPRIYSNFSTDGGATWHTDQVIEDNGDYDKGRLEVGISGSNVVAVWPQWNGSAWRIHSNYSTDGGATWHTDHPIDGSAGPAVDHVHLGMSGSNVVAVFRQKNGSAWRICSNYSTDGGATWHTDQLIQNNAGYTGHRPRVGISDNNVVAVWYQEDESGWRMYSNYSTDGGATWHTDQLIEDNVGYRGTCVEVGISGNNVVAVWTQNDPSPGPHRVYSNYSTDGGATWHADQLIPDNAGLRGTTPRVVILGNNVVAVWYRSDGSAWRIYSNYSIDGGATWHTGQLIQGDVGEYLGEDLEVKMSGSNVVAVWSVWDGSAYRIYSNYSTDGGVTWHTEQLIEDNAGLSGYSPQVAISGNNVVAVWGQWDGSAYRIYSNYGVLSDPSSVSVPTMTEWGLIVFTVLAGIGSVYYLRRQKRAAI